MFPALISEFINADLEYRIERSHRRSVQRDWRRPFGSRAAGRKPHESRPEAAASSWTPRSV